MRASSLSSSDERTGRSGVSSRWHQVTTMTRPPGAVAAASSRTNCFLSGMCSPDSILHTKSYTDEEEEEDDDDDEGDVVEDELFNGFEMA